MKRSTIKLPRPCTRAKVRVQQRYLRLSTLLFVTPRDVEANKKGHTRQNFRMVYVYHELSSLTLRRIQRHNEWTSIGLRIRQWYISIWISYTGHPLYLWLTGIFHWETSQQSTIISFGFTMVDITITRLDQGTFMGLHPDIPCENTTGVRAGCCSPWVRVKSRNQFCAPLPKRVSIWDGNWVPLETKPATAVGSVTKRLPGRIISGSLTGKLTNTCDGASWLGNSDVEHVVFYHTWYCYCFFLLRKWQFLGEV